MNPLYREHKRYAINTPLFGEFMKLGLSKLHQTINFLTVPLEVLDTKGIYRDDLDPNIKADLKDLHDAIYVSDSFNFDAHDRPPFRAERILEHALPKSQDPFSWQTFYCHP